MMITIQIDTCLKDFENISVFKQESLKEKERIKLQMSNMLYMIYGIN